MEEALQKGRWEESQRGSDKPPDLRTVHLQESAKTYAITRLRVPHATNSGSTWERERARQLKGNNGQFLPKTTQLSMISVSSTNTRELPEENTDSLPRNRLIMLDIHQNWKLGR
jgi:hypothetical protein